MSKRLAHLIPVCCALAMLAADQSKVPAMPDAVTDNAVASLKGGLEVYSLMGIGTKKTWDTITNKTFMLKLSSGKWIEEKPVPGVAGRLGASAAGAKGQIFVFGGYTVDGQGNGFTVGDVNSYVPENHRWYRAADIPVPVDSAVIGVAHDRYVYLVGGRAKNGPVNSVQVYDAEKNTWSQATAFPGTPVFGHAGGIADETIVYVDGARKEASGYVASDECWMGKIDKKDPNKIEWIKLPPHPGSGRFGIVAGGWEREHRVVFSGGTLVPHDFKGLAADGKAAPLSPVTFAYEIK
ncbi:MAG TPA: kelch repeat-containing protein, partial [Candidatus Sulfotelmatobacter sp.]|nr:kelch repeat-containing protein [Candidatus Sulfotelmatobacter sp.]